MTLDGRAIDPSDSGEPTPTTSGAMRERRAIDPWEQRKIDFGFGDKPPTPPALTVVHGPPGEITTRERNYALGALRSAAEEMASTSDGRNHEFNKHVFKLTAYIATGALSEAEVVDALTEAGRVASGRGDHPFTESEMRATVRSALAGGRAKGLAKGAPENTGIRAEVGGGNGYAESGAAANDDDVSAGAVATTSGTGRVVTLVPLTDVKDSAARWIWECSDAGRVERGVLSLFAGRPGSGKSTGARWFTSELSRGTLDGCWKGDPQKIAYISAEESDDGVKAGYRAAGADMTRIFLPKVTLDDKAVGLLSRTDEHALTQKLLEAGISVLVVDPLMSTINGKTDLNRNNEIREVLDPWVRIARAIDGTVIGIVHFKKPNGNGGDDVVSMVTGSSAFGEVARCIFGFAKDPEDDTRILQQVKNNRGREDLCLRYRLDEVAITTDSGEQTTASRFVLGGPSDTTVGEALRSGATQGGRPLGAKSLQIVEFVNGRASTSSHDLEEAGLVKDRAEGNTLLHRLYRRKFIDTSVWGIYHPVGTEPQP